MPTCKPVYGMVWGEVGGIFHGWSTALAYLWLGDPCILITIYVQHKYARYFRESYSNYGLMLTDCSPVASVILPCNIWKIRMFHRHWIGEKLGKSGKRKPWDFYPWDHGAGWFHGKFSWKWDDFSVSWVIGVPPVLIHFTRMSHYKSSISIGFSLINQRFWGTPMTLESSNSPGRGTFAEAKPRRNIFSGGERPAFCAMGDGMAKRNGFAERAKVTGYHGTNL